MKPFALRISPLLAGIVLAWPGISWAQRLPAGPPPIANRDYHVASTGTYLIDPNHTAVIPRVSHMGFGYNVFRFGDAAGTLWTPAKPDDSRLDATVKIASIETPVRTPDGKPWSEELLQRFLKAGQFPKSTAFHKTGAETGTVDGVLTLLGVSRPMRFKVRLNGAGRNMFGKSVMGVTAARSLNPQAYGLSPMLGQKVDLSIDTELDRRP